MTKVTAVDDFPSGWSAAESSPDLILCDLSMPGATPLDGIRQMRATAPDAPLLVVTANEDDATMLDLFNLGIAGFVPKNASGEIIEAAIRLVLAGGRYVPPRVVELAGERSATGTPFVNRQSVNDGISKLTDRQIEVLKLMAQGAQNKEIARDMALSPATVKAHVAAIISALDVANRTEAAFKAQQLGLI